MRLMRTRKILFSLFFLCSTQVMAAVPVIPGAHGFGMDTPAGRGGAIFRVTNLNDDGAGSLRSCVEASGPRVCLFEVGGVIILSSELHIRNPFITIAGQTAPYPGISLERNEVFVQASDVLIQHLRIRSGDSKFIDNPDQSSSLSIGVGGGDTVSNIVIDHVSLSWGIDEVFGMSDGFDNVTIRNSIVSEGLDDSLHSKGPHSKGALIRDVPDGHVAMIGNVLAHNNQRNPRVLVRNFVFVNNILYNYGASGLDLAIPDSGYALRHAIYGNLFIKGKDSIDNLPIVLRKHSDGSPVADTAIYVDANRSVDHASNAQWDLVANDVSSSLAATSPPNWFSGMVAMSALTDDVQGSVLADVGARPAERDAVDERIVNDVKTGGGSFINCVADDGSARCAKNGGGWTVVPSTRRELTLPANPDSDSDGDGYTNLEEWLHEMAANVETGYRSPPKAPDLQMQ